MFRPEILAPAGNLFKLKTAVRYGADAVYIAGRGFGLRSAADNFTVDEIRRGTAYAHTHGAKVYVVLNAFLFEEALAEVPPFLKELERADVDALIISDMGVITTVARHTNIPIHLSTQSSTLNVPAARLWLRRGVSRIVLGREVSIAQAGHIKREAGIEVEMFTHGAMCMAYSGNCTISNYTAGRDSNRGGCIQSCRFRYTLSEERNGEGPTGHFFSSKDLQGVAHMTRFAAEEIDSLKIEGRMKSALYTATAARAYRAARDAAMGVETVFGAEALLAELDTMSHRDYTTANLLEPAGSDSVYHQEHGGGHTHDMLGHVVEVRPDSHVAVFLKNPLQPGQRATMITPDGGEYALDTGVLRSLNGGRSAKGNPNRVVLLPYHPKAENDFLLRTPKHAEVPGHTAAI